MLELENEAELAALLGHETGHVNARHSAAQVGRRILTQLAVMGASFAVQKLGHAKVTPLVNIASQIGASALLASYSRDNEREADALGMEYMTRVDYNPDGMVQLMSMLRSQSKEKPSLIETMFATHPMSDERYATARREAETTFASSHGKTIMRERYMDKTARLRKTKSAVNEMQKGEQEMAQGELLEAELHFRKALKLAPNDYAGLVMLGKCQIAQKRYTDADRTLAKVTKLYPIEGQGQHLSGICKLALKRPEEALHRFNRYEEELPGNPTTLFFKGVAYENMQNKNAAIEYYTLYIQSGANDEQAKYAYQRLQSWGVSR
jgi:predicted Zn-dependent protease